MPVKNASPFLKACLDSICQQSFEDWELITVDDHSTDNSMSILKEASKKDKRIKVLKNDESGIIKALSTAFDSSRGDLISRMDADDIMTPHKLELLAAKLKGRKKVVVTGQVKYFSDKEISEGYLRYEKWLNSVVEEERFTEQVFRECVVASPNWLVHRSCFETDITLDSLDYPEDYHMVFKWLSCGYTIEGIPKVLHLWREHPARTSRNSENYQQKAFFKLKTREFVSKFKNELDGLQLIGKGVKGKLIAKELRELKVDFKWYDLNPSNSEQSSVLNLNQGLSILSNWPLEEKTQDDISIFLNKRGLKFSKNLWLF